MLGTSLRVPRPSILLAAALVAMAGTTDLARANFDADFEGRIFVELIGRYAKDHSIIRHTDGVYHIFYSRGNAGGGWNLPGSEIDIGHATSTDLVHWNILGPVLQIDTVNNWKERNIWAPNVLRVDMVIGGQNWPYVMAYAGVDSSRSQQIGIAVSSDLNTWTDLSILNGAHRPNTQWALWEEGSDWQNCRDPFLIKQGNQLWLLTSVQTRPEYQNAGIRGAIAIATSTDGLNWVDSGGPLLVNDHSSLLASSHLEKNPITNLWHLFYTKTIEPGGVFSLTSGLMDQGWVLSNATQFDPLAISSEIATLGSELVYSRAVDYQTQEGLQTRAVRLDRLNWTAGGATLVPVNLFTEQWSLASGNLGAVPTFRDRPHFRTNQSSNMQGVFWVNTGENFNGPLGGGCATCLANEAQVGVLRSRGFTSHGLTLRLRVGGTASPLAYVALVDSVTGSVLQEAHGLGTEVMTERVWNIGTYVGDRLYLEIRDGDPNGHVSVDEIHELGDATGVPGAPPVSTLAPLRVSPNPTSGPINLSYELGQASGVVLAVYDPAGRLVRELALGTQVSGPHEITWDGRNRDGSPVPAGVYFVRMLRDGAPFTNAATRVTIIR
jgi:hypothetical protein